MSNGTKRGPKPKIAPDDILQEIKESEHPGLSTGQLADRLDSSNPTVRKRLKPLEKEGKLSKNVVGSNIPVWYLPRHRNRTLSSFADGERTLADGKRTLADAVHGQNDDTRSKQEGGLAGESDDDPSESEDPVADGGTLVRPVLRMMTAICLAGGVVLFLATYILTVGLERAVSVDIVKTIFSLLLTGAITFLPTMTSYPEKIDRRINRQARRLGRRVREVTSA